MSLPTFEDTHLHGTWVPFSAPSGSSFPPPAPPQMCLALPYYVPALTDELLFPPPAPLREGRLERGKGCGGVPPLCGRQQPLCHQPPQGVAHRNRARGFCLVCFKQKSQCPSVRAGT